MPPAVAAAAIAGGASVATGVIGSRAQSGANRRASTMQAKSDADALAFQREQEAQRRREFELTEGEARRRWDAEQAIAEEERSYARRLQDEREARMAPRRAASQAALMRMGDLLGIPFDARTPNVAPPTVAPAGAGVREPANHPMTMGRLLPQAPDAGMAPATPATEMAYSPVLSMNRLMPKRRPYAVA